MNLKSQESQQEPTFASGDGLPALAGAIMLLGFRLAVIYCFMLVIMLGMLSLAGYLIVTGVFCLARSLVSWLGRTLVYSLGRR